MPLKIVVKSTNEEQNQARRAVVGRVVSEFGSAVPDIKLLCFFDDRDCRVTTCRPKSLLSSAVRLAEELAAGSGNNPRCLSRRSPRVFQPRLQSWPTSTAATPNEAGISNTASVASN